MNIKTTETFHDNEYCPLQELSNETYSKSFNINTDFYEDARVECNCG